jgi:metallo-beta-lactamase class B
MKILYKILLSLFSMSSQTWAIETVLRIDGDIELRQLKPDAYVVTYKNANSLVVKMGNGKILMVNTLYDAQAAHTLLEWVKTRYHTYPSAAINTHFHNDTLGGNAAFIDRGIPIYGSNLTVDTLRHRESSMRNLLLGWAKTSEEKQKISHQKFIPPTRAFNAVSGLVLNFGGEQIILEYPGAAHSPDNIVVYFKNKKILFGGCMIMAGEKVGNKSDADLTRWPEALEKVRHFDADFIVPGHGIRFDTGLINHTLTLLANDRVSDSPAQERK